jgi:anti-sigma factor RsiW
MNCRELEGLITFYIDGELSQDEVKSLEEHILECRDCQESLRELRMVKEALRRAPLEEVPAELHGLIMSNIVPEESYRPSFVERMLRMPKKFSGFRRLSPAIAAMMVMVMLASISGTLLFTQWFPQRDAAQGLVEGIQYRAYEAPSNSFTSDEVGTLFSASMPEETEGTKAMNRVVSLDAEKRIVRNGRLDIEVSRGKVESVAQRARDIVSRNQGYIESSAMSRVEQGPKEAVNYYMQARIPADNLEKTMDELLDMGKVLRSETSAQDITDKYIDLTARLEAKETQEKRLLQIMGEAGTVGELMQVESELSRVRGEIESMKGQIQYYDKVTTMAGLSVSVSEEGFASKLTSPWDDIWDTFVGAWRNLAMFFAGILPTALVIAIGVMFVVKMLGRKTNNA